MHRWGKLRWSSELSRYIRAENSINKNLKIYFSSGYNFVLRKLAKTLVGIEEFRKLDGNSYGFYADTRLTHFHSTFKENEEFIENATDGRKYKTKYHFEERKIIQIQKRVGSEDTVTTIRDYNEDELTMTYIVKGNVMAKRFFKKL